MILPFDPRASRIVIVAEIAGRIRTTRARLLLDTGASFSVLSGTLLAELGYNPTSEGVLTTLTTGSRQEQAWQLFAKGMTALGVTREDFPVVCHDPPPEARLDGVLGIDFFRGHVLTLDFVNGILTFE
jgi:aspartyl protease family protein